MYKLQEKIIDYMNHNSVRTLTEELGMGVCTLYAIKNGNRNRKYRKQTLDALYDYFELDKDCDGFYKEFIKVNADYDDILGNIFKQKRESLGLSRHEVAKIIKGTERQLLRIETGETRYTANSYYIKELMKLYNFTDDEQEVIMKYISSLYDLTQVQKNMSLYRTQNIG